MSKSLFDYLNHITVDKAELTEEELKGYSPFMINRFVSMSEIFLPFVARKLNQHDIKKENHYRLMKDFLPKRKQYFKYIKSKKDGMDYEIECLQKYFEVGVRDAEHFLTILTKDELKEIVNKFSSLKGRV